MSDASISLGADNAQPHHAALALNSRSMWLRALMIGAAILLLFLLDRFTFVLMDAWLLQSLGLEAMFWTNFRAASLLFIWGFVGPLVAVALPALTTPLDSTFRRTLLVIAVMFGLLGGYLLAGRYLEFLLLFNGGDVGEPDPVFGRDIGFYLFKLPALWTIWAALVVPLLLGMISTAICAGFTRPHHERQPFHARNKLVAGFSSGLSLFSILALGVLAAAGIWLSNYNFLYGIKDTAAFFSGANYVDVSGFFSYVNYNALSAVLVLAATGLIILMLVALRRGLGDPTIAHSMSPRVRPYVRALAVLVVVDFAFATAVATRDAFFISPNEPIIQLPYIERHIAGTLRGWDLENVESASFVPPGLSDPLPTAEELLESPTLKNAPLWPGWVSYVERLLDPQHASRVLMQKGDPTVYGPVLEVFRAQQKLRTYYDFMDLDTVRYTIGGEKRLLVSGVRELPLEDPQDWVSHWGQRMLLFTHGHGMVIAPASEIRGEGEMNLLASGIPMRSAVPELLPENPSIYYGNGAGVVMAASNAAGIQELHFPTDEDREQVIYPPSVKAGVPMDSLLKKLVIGWRSGNPFDLWFSDLITGETRMHFYRQPLERLERIAPFLFIESNMTAVVEGGGIKWLINGITTSNHYPYSWRWTLGDKSTDQYFADRDVREVNYVRDSVKAVVDAYTGDLRLYQIADEPVANAWGRIYPGLFNAGSEMPAGIRAHLQYPQELFHAQFDDIWILYHMRDALTYFNLEDMWDDADEVKGPILTDGEAITFSIEPRHWILETGGVLPESSDKIQFAQSMVFTNEHALNLRAIATVYQDGADYGRKVVVTIPKGHFTYGPEQADSIIDQDPAISERISWWNRTGSEVIRGHTSTLIVGRELLFVEPLFTRSKQNPVPQLKRVIVVMRGIAADGENLDEAIRNAIESVRAKRPTSGPVAQPAPAPVQPQPFGG